MTQPIDRAVLVRRHNPASQSFDPLSAFTVGNGEFAFTADATGLQTFPKLYAERFPLCTASHWGWHTTPASEALRGQQIRATDYDAHGRAVPYVTDKTGQEELFDWLRRNPHRLHLGRIGLELRHRDGRPAQPEDISRIDQRLDLWTGILYSDFEFAGETVTVITCCAGKQDSLAIRVQSRLVTDRQLGIRLSFPYGSPTMEMADWDHDEHHQSRLTQDSSGAKIVRQLDGDIYYLTLGWPSGAAAVEQTSTHHFLVSNTSGSDTLELTCAFPRPRTGFRRCRRSPMVSPLPRNTGSRFGTRAGQSILEIARTHAHPSWSDGSFFRSM
jgi:hypothetical protein